MNLLREGIPLDHKVAADLRALAQELGVEYNHADAPTRPCFALYWQTM